MVMGLCCFIVSEVHGLLYIRPVLLNDFHHLMGYPVVMKVIPFEVAISIFHLGNAQKVTIGPRQYNAYNTR